MNDYTREFVGFGLGCEIKYRKYFYPVGLVIILCKR